MQITAFAAFVFSTLCTYAAAQGSSALVLVYGSSDCSGSAGEFVTSSVEEVCSGVGGNSIQVSGRYMRSLHICFTCFSSKLTKLEKWLLHRHLEWQ